MQKQDPVQIAVWSDYVCPFCYLELPVLDRIKSELGHQVDVDWRAFELRPDPVPTLPPNGEYLHRVWNQSVYPMARERSLELRLPPVQPRSRKAHEAAEFAREAGRFDAMHEALFKAFFQDGRDLAEVDVLVDVGRAVGLDAAELRASLESARFTRKVLDDEQLAREIGITGVPALLIRAGARGYLLSGAQPYEAVKSIIERAASESEILA